MPPRPPAPLLTLTVVLALTAVTLLVTRAGQQPADAAGPALQSGAATGANLYGRDCAGCHGPAGDGSRRGPALTQSGEAGAHYMLVTGRMPIADPDQPIRRRTPRYTDEEIDALVGHVAGFGDGPRLPDVDPDEGESGLGGRLYRLHCGACHSATGIGGALAFDEFAPSLAESEPSVVAAAITSGPGAMPSFSRVGFTDEELASVVVHVRQLQQPADAGGWPIFRAGRADEALVAWALAMPMLVLAAAWVARRPR